MRHICERIREETDLSEEVIQAYHRSEIGIEDLPKRWQDVILNILEEAFSFGV